MICHSGGGCGIAVGDPPSVLVGEAKVGGEVAESLLLKEGKGSMFIKA